MPAAQTRLDISSISIGGSDRKQFVSEGSIEFIPVTMEGRSVVDPHNRPNKEAKSVQLTVTLYDDVATNVRASKKDVSALTLGGNSFSTFLESLTVNKTYQHDDSRGNATEWLFPIYVGEDTSSSCQLMIPTAGYPGFALGMEADGQAAVDLALSTTINGVTVSFPAMMERFANSLPQQGRQLLDISLLGTGVATSPSGTSSLLAAALNAPFTAVALSVSTKSTGGSVWAGNALIQSLAINVPVTGPVTTQFTYVSQGAWTIGATT
jgi:hypothetical protein